MTHPQVQSFITVSSGMGGFFAVQMWFNDQDPDYMFWEPYQTGHGRYPNVDAAIREAKQWAEAEGLVFKQ